jgi:hypothetical protein
MISEPDGSAGSDPISAAARKSARAPRPDHASDQSFQRHQLPPYLVAGNRFASTGLVCALVGLALALVDGWPAVAWSSGVAGVVLAAVGFVKYCRGSATNRDSAASAGAIAWVALVILLTRVSVALGIPMITPAP